MSDVDTSIPPHAHSHLSKILIFWSKLERFFKTIDQILTEHRTERILMYTMTKNLWGRPAQIHWKPESWSSWCWTQGLGNFSALPEHRLWDMSEILISYDNYILYDMLLYYNSNYVWNINIICDSINIIIIVYNILIMSEIIIEMARERIRGRETRSALLVT